MKRENLVRVFVPSHGCLELTVFTTQDGYQTVKDHEVRTRYPKAYKDLRKFGVITTSKTVPFGRLVYALWHRRYMGPRYYRGRKVEYHVHHQDGNRANNQIDNLVLLPAKHHQQLHTDKENGKPINRKTAKAINDQLVRLVRVTASTRPSKPQHQGRGQVVKGKPVEAPSRPYNPSEYIQDTDSQSQGGRGPPKPYRSLTVDLFDFIY